MSRVHNSRVETRWDQFEAQSELSRNKIVSKRVDSKQTHFYLNEARIANGLAAHDHATQAFNKSGLSGLGSRMEPVRR